MSKERVVLNSQFGSLRLHHIDRVVKESVSKGACGRGHEDSGRRLVSHQDWKRADMIKVGVSDNDGVKAVMWKVLVTGNAGLSFFLRMHSCIEHNACVANLEQVAIGADPSGPVKESEASFGHDFRAVKGGAPRSAWRLGWKLIDINVAGGGFEPPTQGL